jgi:hypothetical protein
VEKKQIAIKLFLIKFRGPVEDAETMGRGEGLLRGCVLSLCVLMVASGGVIKDGAMPDPFRRILREFTPAMQGNDVIILQHLLNRSSSETSLVATGLYDKATVEAVVNFQHLHKPSSEKGVFGANEAIALLECCSDDGYTDDGIPARVKGYMYKVHVKVNQNRSFEHNATLYDADGGYLFSFRVRLHGHSSVVKNTTWPSYTTDVGRNQFSSGGNTPTGLMSFDLNSPEDVPKLYGPYPVNRAVAGLEGNAKFLLPHIRNGILMHTGEWPGWHAPESMPNSAGCIHSWPANIKSVWNILVGKLGVVVHKNTNGKTPYPYKPQGLLSVEQIR